MLKEKIIYLDNGEEKYPLLFSTNVIEILQLEFNEVDIIEKIRGNGSMPDFRVLNPFLFELINEGIRYMNRFAEKKRKPVTKEQVGWVISEAGWNKAFETIKKAIELGMPSQSESPKNDKATQNVNP